MSKQPDPSELRNAHAAQHAAIESAMNSLREHFPNVLIIVETDDPAADDNDLSVNYAGNVKSLAFTAELFADRVRDGVAAIVDNVLSPALPEPDDDDEDDDGEGWKEKA